MIVRLVALWRMFRPSHAQRMARLRHELGLDEWTDGTMS